MEAVYSWSQPKRGFSQTVRKVATQTVIHVFRVGMTLPAARFGARAGSATLVHVKAVAAHARKEASAAAAFATRIIAVSKNQYKGLVSRT